jgi:hypothetical protein
MHRAHCLKNAAQFPTQSFFSLQTHSPSLFAMTIKNLDLQKCVRAIKNWACCGADVRIVPRRPIYLFPAALLIHLLLAAAAVDVFQQVWKNCTQMPTCTTLLYISNASQRGNQMCNYFHKYFHATIIRRLLIAS